MQLIQGGNKKLFSSIVGNVLDGQPWNKLKEKIRCLDDQEQVNEKQQKEDVEVEQCDEEVLKDNKQQKNEAVDQNIVQIQKEYPQQPRVDIQDLPVDKQQSQQSIKAVQTIEKQQKQQQNDKQYHNEFQLQIPPTIQPTPQPQIQQSKPYISESSMRKSSQQSINLQLTQKPKKQNNLPNIPKQDSLVYSNTTLMYSNQTSLQADGKSAPKPSRSQSQKQKLIKIQDHQSVGDDIDENIDRAQSRQMDRVPTQSRQMDRVPTQSRQMDRVPTQSYQPTQSMHKSSQNDPSVKAVSRMPTQTNKSQIRRKQTQQAQSGVFQTQINDYKSRLGKIREMKQSKKKKLQAQLRKVNNEILEINKKQRQGRQAHSNGAHYQSRVRISDNIQALAKAQKLVRGLRYQKQSRQQLHLGQVYNIDKNINGYMEQLVNQRHRNEEMLKQRKKIEIIQRMKLQQMRKIQQQKQKQKNVHFVNYLKNSNSNKAQLSPNKPTPPPPILPAPVPQTHVSRQRMASKKSQVTQPQLTPQLSRKKAYLKKLRNVSFHKNKVDKYEQILS